jgi:Dolichyl-phosphate-mannose-protein mannosyltransferase
MLNTVRSFDGLHWLFSHNDLGESGSSGHFYRPLWVAWNWAIYRLFGASGAAFHIGSFLLFALLALEVWALIRLLAGERAAWTGAFFFALYPRHGEAVAWLGGSPDLPAPLLTVAALLWLYAVRRPWLAIAGAGVLGGAAALGKEIAFVVPLLAALLLLAYPRERVRWLGVAAIGVAQLVVLVVRWEVVGGFGGYGYPLRPLRGLASVASYFLAAVTPPQLELAQALPFFVCVAVVLGLALWRLSVLHRRGAAERMRLAYVGVAWFVVSLAPLVTLTVDLNDSNGERLLMLASVGVAMVAGALIEWRALAIAAPILAALCLLSAYTWVVAGRVEQRVVRETVALAPKNTEVIFLAAPSSYRNAHLFPQPTMDYILRVRGGRPDLTSAFCAQVHLRELDRGAVTIRTKQPGMFGVSAHRAAGIDVPVLRPGAALTTQCRFTADSGGGWPPGLDASGTVQPTPLRPATVVYFDGHDVRRCC